jgi:hypothetical protein
MVAEMGDNSSYQQAQVLAAWGDKEGAVRALQAAVAAQDNGISQLRGDPMLASVRGDPRVVRIMAEVGFPA